MSRRMDGSDRGYLITGEAVARLAKGVHAADNSRRSIKAPKLRTAFDDDFAFLKLGKTLAAWAKNTLATVEIYPLGTPPNEQSGNPVELMEDCVNKFADIESGSWVMLGLAENRFWYVIAAECFPGTDSGPSDP